jgi:hypothetical protein
LRGFQKASQKTGLNSNTIGASTGRRIAKRYLSNKKDRKEVVDHGSLARGRKKKRSKSSFRKPYSKKVEVLRSLL